MAKTEKICEQIDQSMMVYNVDGVYNRKGLKFNKKR